MPEREKRVGFAAFLNIAFTILEIVGGIWTNSLAIISDALHDFGDSVARQIRYPGFVDTLGDIVRTMKMARAALTLEVRESAVLSDAHQTRTLLERIKALGVNITLDDFGTGMGAINALRDMPIDAIKIDHSLIADMTLGAQGCDTVGALITMGHSFGRTVIAEGVETTEQLKLLKDLGCDGVQGYLFCKPLKSAEVPPFIKGFSLSSGSQ